MRLVIARSAEARTPRVPPSAPFPCVCAIRRGSGTELQFSLSHRSGVLLWDALLSFEENIFINGQ